MVIVYCTIQIVHVYYEFNAIFWDYVMTVVIMTVVLFIFNYNNIKKSKIQFLQAHKITLLLEEQQKIFQHLPDGAIIHRSQFGSSGYLNSERVDKNMIKSEKSIQV